MKPEPEQVEYTNAMLPGLLLGAFMYWLLFFVVALLTAVYRGNPVPRLLAIAAVCLIMIPTLIFFVGFAVRMILCKLNQSLGNPVGCSNLAVCVSGLTHYLITAWIPLFVLLYDQDALLLLLTTLKGPLLAVACGSVAVRMYERRQRTYVPYPRSRFQFQLQHLFVLTFVAAILLVCARSLSNFQLLVFPIGYCLLQVAILMLLSWLPPVKYEQLSQTESEEMLDFANSGR